MDSVAIQVELTEAVCKLSGHGTLGQKGSMSEYRKPCEKLEGTSWYLSLFYVFPVFEKGIMSVKEEHRGVIAVTGLGISKGWGLRICRVIFNLGPGVQGAPKQRHVDFQSLVVTVRAEKAAAVQLTWLQ